VERPLCVDSRAIAPFTTDLGFEVRLLEARLAVADFEFATAGELHAAARPPSFISYLISPAYAHPGHYEGGEVVGEARGQFVLDWVADDERELTSATLITTDYSSGNFTFARAGVDAGVAASDPLLGHTALFAGSARLGDFETSFRFVLDLPDDRVLVGVPFPATITTEREGSVLFALLLREESGQTTLFDQIDFSALEGAGAGQVDIGPASTTEVDMDAYNHLRRAVGTHDYYELSFQPVATGHSGGAP